MRRITSIWTSSESEIEDLRIFFLVSMGHLFEDESIHEQLRNRW